MNPARYKKDFDKITEELRSFAYSYLEKYSPSKQQLKTYLFKKILTRYKSYLDKKIIFTMIDEIINSLEKKSLVSDKYYSESRSKTFLKRGYSLNKIRYALIKKGIEEKYINNSILKIKEDNPDSDFFSAIKLCKRKRIGAVREEGNRKLFYKKDMSILARSGFSFEISKSVLNLSKNEFLKLSKLV